MVFKSDKGRYKCGKNEKKMFGKYKVEKLMDGLYALDDGRDSSFYVLEGSKKPR